MNKVTKSKINPHTPISRRALLRGVVLMGGAAGLLSACGAGATSTLAPSTQPTATMSMDTALGQSRPPSKDFMPDVEIDLAATRSDVQLLAGKPTQVLTYKPQVTKGAAESATALLNSAAGPIIRVKKGQKVRINFTNKLPSKDDASVIHWHGLMLPEDMDGHPRFAIAPGQSYAYEFEVVNRAGTYWFHPHPHGQTARQVYNGLAGMFIVSDDEEAALGLPAGEHDVPLIIQDAPLTRITSWCILGRA
jgi:FtsP/CotA-like multicopper oxidase with cupredoxin domain